MQVKQSQGVISALLIYALINNSGNPGGNIIIELIDNLTMDCHIVVMNLYPVPATNYMYIIVL